jgi:hypothetical protein
MLFAHTASLLADLDRHPVCSEHRLLSIDGVPLPLPHTPAHAAFFGTTRSQHGAAYFPQASAVWVFNVATNGVIAQSLGPANESDQRVAPRLLPGVIRPGDLLLGDGHYSSFPIQAAIQAARAYYLVRASGTLKPENHLVASHAPGDLDLHLRPTQAIRAAYPNWNAPRYLAVRAVQFQIPVRDALNDFAVATFLTNLPRDCFPRERLAALFPLRWNQETAHNDIKTRLGLGEIRSQTPAGATAEILAHLCCANMVRLMLHRANRGLQALSFTAALCALRQANQQLRYLPHSNAHIADVLLDILRQQPLDLRPGRSQPRMRRPDKRPFPSFTTPREQWRHARKAG